MCYLWCPTVGILENCDHFHGIIVFRSIHIGAYANDDSKSVEPCAESISHQLCEMRKVLECRVSTSNWKMNELSSKIRQVPENGYWNTVGKVKCRTTCKEIERKHVSGARATNVRQKMVTAQALAIVRNVRCSDEHWLILSFSTWGYMCACMLRKPCMCNLPQNSQFTPENSIMYWRCFCHAFSVASIFTRLLLASFFLPRFRLKRAAGHDDSLAFYHVIY